MTASDADEGRPPGAPVPGPPVAFSEPTRLAPVSVLLNVLVSLQQGIVAVLFLAFALPNRYLTFGFLIVLGAVLFGYQGLRWSRLTYRIEGDVLRLEEGILARKRREVPLRRIQQVDLQRKLRHRMFGVCIVSIDTAGGTGGAEVVLDAITDADALQLRRVLLASGTAQPAQTAQTATAPVAGAPPSDPGAPSPPPDQQLVARLTTWDLVKAGITGSRLAAVLPLAGLAFGFLGDLPSAVSDELTDSAGTLFAVGAVISLLLFAAVPVVLLVAAAVSVFADHDFTLVRVGDDLHLRRGLLDQREATLSLHRIQVVRVMDNPVRRWLGICSVQLQSAGSGSDAQGSVSRITIPIVPNNALPGVLHQTIAGSAPLPSLIPAPAAARRRAWFRRLVPVALLVAALYGLTTSTWALLAAVVLVPTAVGAEMAFRGLGHAVLPSFVVARRGGFLRETVVVPVAKAQSARLSASLLQRRLGLATLSIDVAGQGRTPAVVDGDAELLAQLRGRALGTPAARADEAAVRRRNRGMAAEQLPFAP